MLKQGCLTAPRVALKRSNHPRDKPPQVQIDRKKLVVSFENVSTGQKIMIPPLDSICKTFYVINVLEL